MFFSEGTAVFLLNSLFYKLTVNCTLIGGFVHGGHAGTVVFAGEARDVNLQRYGPNGGAEVEEAHL